MVNAMQLWNLGCRVMDNTLYVAGMTGGTGAQMLAMDLYGQTNYSLVAEWKRSNSSPLLIHQTIKDPNINSRQSALVVLQSQSVTTPSSQGVARPGTDILGSDEYNVTLSEYIRWIPPFQPNNTIVGLLAESHALLRFDLTTHRYTKHQLPATPRVDLNTAIQYNNTIIVINPTSILTLDIALWQWNTSSVAGEGPSQLITPSVTVMEDNLYVMDKNAIFALDLIALAWKAIPSPATAGCLTQAGDRALILVNDNATYIADSNKSFLWRSIPSPFQPSISARRPNIPSPFLFIGTTISTLVIVGFVIYVMCIRPSQHWIELGFHQKGTVKPAPWAGPSPLLNSDHLRPEPARLHNARLKSSPSSLALLP
ncbi:hypothetical protein DSO57_1022857 [Entomophthora muscae]|uniref:Uncharacterized protein n=1 Tax=Entomophthora muscae TaxID=34485 RepID=A0ACC2RU23_9FUNG|nr:hypothetical protein DSO57_1022857 [Entomophthora muscae]